MSAYRDLLRAAANATRPTPERMRRLRSRVLSRLPDAVVTRALGRRLPDVTSDRAAQLRSRVLEGPPPRPSRARLAAMALAAAAVVVGFVYAGNPSAQPSEPAPVPFVATLEASGGLTRSSPIAGVDLEFEGVGRMDVDGQSVRLGWDVGLLRVEVAPHQGIDLQVATREGTITVVGTGFTVNRSALGTAVDVSHGIVEVACSDGEPRRYRAGESALCLPISAAGLLGRAGALSDARAPAEDVLDALDRALGAAAPEDAVRMEIEATRVFVLMGLHRDADALAQAEAYLAHPSPPREAEMRRVAEDLRRRLP